MQLPGAVSPKGGPLRIYGAVMRHVVLRGRVGRLMLSPVFTPVCERSEWPAWFSARKAYFADVDWAIDVAEVQAEELSLAGVPASLIRRDPETQVVVRAQNLDASRLGGVDLSGTYWPQALELIAFYGLPDLVLVAPRRNRRFAALVKGLRNLQEAGIADPH